MVKFLDRLCCHLPRVGFRKLEKINWLEHFNIKCFMAAVVIMIKETEKGKKPQLQTTTSSFHSQLTSDQLSILSVSKFCQFQRFSKLLLSGKTSDREGQCSFCRAEEAHRFVKLLPKSWSEEEITEVVFLKMIEGKSCRLQGSSFILSKTVESFLNIVHWWGAQCGLKALIAI